MPATFGAVVSGQSVVDGSKAFYGNNLEEIAEVYDRDAFLLRHLIRLSAGCLHNWMKKVYSIQDHVFGLRYRSSRYGLYSVLPLALPKT
ncbi:hypothetical protein DESC_800027 [Desulfosarcina cetonica]|uniref:hypothetical protein n=1 Tax=Desulfosarcina cetonica TaxID=90730 RepID=UPI0006CFAA49|nr:hypothetical protein [Desulfosarcina cetonica]VTR70413.1 hypothetical protein DESC_800027 [Desulfosarcina cetonica]